MEDPGFLPLEVQQQFIDQFKGAHIEIYEFPHQFIMVACYVDNPDAPGDQSGEVPDYHQVEFWKISFSKLQDIYDISIQDKRFRFYAVQVFQQFFGMAAKGAKMYIGNNYKVDCSFGDAWLFHI